MTCGSGKQMVYKTQQLNLTVKYLWLSVRSKQNHFFEGEEPKNVAQMLFPRKEKSFITTVLVSGAKKPRQAR